MCSKLEKPKKPVLNIFYTLIQQINYIYIYIFDFKSNQIFIFNLKNIKHFLENITHSHIIITRHKADKTIQINHGACKIVAFKNEFVYSFFFIKRIYDWAKRDFLKNYNLLNYPKVGVFQFDDSSLLEIMEYVKGNIKMDTASNQIIEKCIIENITIENSCLKNGIVQSIQHGDAKPQNIIWENNQFKFIDIDFIGYRPFLFDLFWYISSTNKDKKHVKNLVLKNKNQLMKTYSYYIKVNNFEEFWMQITQNYIEFLKKNKSDKIKYSYLL